MVAGKPSNASYNVSYTAGQTGPGLYTGANFIVKSGFQYFYSISPFSFSITNIDIDFGTLTPANPVYRQSYLSVSNQSANGYIVSAYENHQLLFPAMGALIPDTTCDSGTSCTQVTPGLWTSTLTYGFGYRCDLVSGTNYCSADFSNSNNYKQFADNSKSESAQTIFSSHVSGKNQQAQVTYKVNISSMQPAGTYNNVITYVATPTF